MTARICATRGDAGRPERWIVRQYLAVQLYIGTFLTPTTLRWSNGSIWRKVYDGPTVININDNWTDGLTDQFVTQANGYLALNMSAVHRPNAVGYMTGPDRFLVSFPDDPNTPFATLRAGPGSISTASSGRTVPSGAAK